MKRTYTCRHCARVFKRSEHCARHERVHTQEKPFPCAYCGRRYARKDLVKRHERTLHTEQYRKAHPEEFGSGSRLSEDSGTPHTPHPLPPLTPPDEFTFVSEGGYAAFGDVTNAAPTLSHDMPAPFRVSPPSSAGDGERHLSLGYYDREETDYLNMPVNMDLYPTPIPGTHTAFPVQTGGDVYHETPSKRRRIEIDPLILESPLLMGDPAAGTPISHLRARAYSDAIDPALETVQFTPPSIPQHSPSYGDLSEHVDLSGEYLALFDAETPTCVQAADNEQPYRPRVRDDTETCADLPAFHFDQETHRRICEETRARMSPIGLSETLLPSLSELQQFFSGYLQGFHLQFPIVHLHSFDLCQTPSPLIMAMCSIGAQYRLCRQEAKNLFILAGTMSSHALKDGLPILNGNPGPAPLWVMQTRVLLSLSGIFSGKPAVVLRTVENLGLFAIDFRLRKTMINRSDVGLEWEEWINRESSKRLLCGMYIVSNLISTAFGVTHGFSHTDDIDFEVLDEEKFWNARSAQEWQKLREMEVLRERSTVRDTMARMLSGRECAPRQSSGLSVLTVLLLAHAMNVYTGCMRDVIETSPKNLQDTLLESTLLALSKCGDILAATRPRIAAWAETEAQLMFNSQGVVHMAYVRLFLDMSTFNRLMLINDNPDEIAAAAYSFAEAALRRGPHLTTTVRKFFAILLGIVKSGRSMVSKTAALSWSLERAISHWVGTMLITKWIHELETNTLLESLEGEEVELLQGFKNLLAKTEWEHSGISIAGAIAQVCSTMLDEGSVWGVTPRMAHVLQHLAVVYEERHGLIQLDPAQCIGDGALD